ncbi:MAG: MarR family winged helix-turn-helix transcriptional regulator, partial [Lachnospiraceae bacterium]|nr:MarR family winged helix-turn-helix transcriptional regulator [Lachnospiraceae bacterium]
GIHQVSKMAGNLSDRGLVKWSHDGNGSEGTYLILTDYGSNIMEEKEKVLREYYGRVIHTFGKENVVQLLTLMQRLETVMNEELEHMEEENE